MVSHPQLGKGQLMLRSLIPSPTWRSRAQDGVVFTIVVTLLFAAVAVFFVWDRTDDVEDAQLERSQAVTRNHFWDMVAGAPLDESVEGRLAGDVRAKLGEENPAKALLETFVEPNEYPGIERRLGMDVFEEQVVGDDESPGYLSDSFVLSAWQATPATVGDLKTETDSVLPTEGLLTWRNYLLGLAVPAVLYLTVVGAGILLGFVVRPVSALRRRRQEERAFRALPSTAQDVILLKRKLEAYPSNDPHVQKARTLADQVYRRVTSGVLNEQAALDVALDMRSIQQELEDIASAADHRIKAYKDLRS